MRRRCPIDAAVVVLLLLIAATIGLYDVYSVQRTYADLYATRHGHIPPLIDWFFVPDPDAEVERWRRLHRNLYLLVAALAAAAVLVALIGLPIGG